MELDERTPVGDIASASEATASVLERYGIDYCCDRKPTLEDWNTALLTDLVEADLRIHIHMENNILFPRTIALERNN